MLLRTISKKSKDIEHGPRIEIRIEKCYIYGPAYGRNSIQRDYSCS